MEVGVFLSCFQVKKKGKKKTHSFSKMKFLKTSFKLGIVQKFKNKVSNGTFIGIIL